MPHPVRPASRHSAADGPAGKVAGPDRLPQNRHVLYLVDASVFIFRAWFSVPIEFADRDGNPVNAVHGFARFLGDLLEREAPVHVAVAFDESLEQSYRNEIYPAYKANREPAPAELKRQFGLCRELVRALGVVEFGSSRYEADDIIGTLTMRARAEGMPVTIASRDKDLTQLVGWQDTYWDAVADVRYGYDDIAERFGVIPERMADFLALMGDAVDNIPGVPGVGRKTAATLLKHFDTLPGVFENLEAVSKLKFRNATFVAQSLREHRESAFLSRQLTGIACDMPLAVGPGDLGRRPPDLAALEEFYERLGFGRLLREQARRIAQR
jgi:DNA polymerase-1